MEFLLATGGIVLFRLLLRSICSRVSDARQLPLVRKIILASRAVAAPALLVSGNKGSQRPQTCRRSDGGA